MGSGRRAGGPGKERLNLSLRLYPRANKNQEAAQLPRSHLSTDPMEHLPAAVGPALLGGEGERWDIHRWKFYIRALIRGSELLPS